MGHNGAIHNIHLHFVSALMAVMWGRGVACSMCTLYKQEIEHLSPTCVSCTSIPMRVVFVDYGWRMAISVDFKYGDVNDSNVVYRPKLLLFDTGSSTAAICNEDILSEEYIHGILGNSLGTVSCNTYASGQWYNGPFFLGAAKTSSGVLLPGRYAYMQHQKLMPCNGKLNGIFGVAFRDLDSYYNATPLNEPSYNQAATTDTSSQKWCSKQLSKMIRGTYNNPFMQRVLDGHGAQGRVYGVWLNHTLVNVDSLKGDGEDFSKSEVLNSVVGQLFIGESSTRTHNRYYNSQFAVTAYLFDSYDLDKKLQHFYAIRVSGMSMEGTSYLFRSTNAILDTGTSTISVPSSLYNKIKHIVAMGDSDRTYPLRLKTLHGSEVNLGDAIVLYKLNMLQVYDSQITLGFPLWVFNYVVTDVGSRTIQFVPHHHKRFPVNATIMCQSCSPGTGTYTLNGQTSCQNCPSGKFSLLRVGSSATCQDCQVGTVAASPGMHVCIPCPNGTHSNSVGGTQCIPCSYGTRAIRLDNGTTKCVACGFDHYQDAMGATSCKECPVGKYVHNLQSTHCHDCSAERFQNESNILRCWPIALKIASDKNVIGYAVIAGAIVLVMLIALLVWCYCCRRGRREKPRVEYSNIVLYAL